MHPITGMYFLLETRVEMINWAKTRQRVTERCHFSRALGDGKILLDVAEEEPLALHLGLCRTVRFSELSQASVACSGTWM